MASLKNMAAFVAVVEHKNFSQAGRELRVSTAVISARVAKLEADIGVRLLNRTTRHVVPTEEALIYFEDCKRIIAQVDAAEAALSSRERQPVGSLKITAPLVFGRRFLAPLLPRFQMVYPKVQIRLHLSDTFVDLIKDGMDMGIRIADLPDSTMIARKLGDSPRVICASPDYLRRTGNPQTPNDLLNHNCLLLRFPGSTQFQWGFLKSGEKYTIPVKGDLDSNNGDVLRDWALAGHGICLKSRWEVEKELERGELVEILKNDSLSPVNISAIHPSGNITPPKVRLFIDFLVETFGTSLTI
ncbi:MAG: LysR family transcriptional regulator [Sneathiella sp.]|nr:LysR family transcriptional regulator [Sneathiella sp.]